MKDSLFFAHKLGGYFNITKTPASIIYILPTGFWHFFFLGAGGAFSTIKCEKVNMSMFIGIFHLVYSCPLQSKLKQLN